MTDPIVETGRQALEIESRALSVAAARLGAAFRAAVELIEKAPGRTVVTGIGKSGLVGRKIAATPASTGTPALFVHATEALHGDAGMVLPGDVVIAISNSGETDEVFLFCELLDRRGIPDHRDDRARRHPPDRRNIERSRRPRRGELPWRGPMNGRVRVVGSFMMDLVGCPCR